MLKPIARSALGGEFGVANAVGITCGVAITERSDIAGVLVSACVDGCEARITAIVGVELPSEPGLLVGGEGPTAIWLSPRSWILQCAIEDEARIQNAVLAAFPDGTAHAAGFTDHLCWLELSGGDPLQLLCRGAFVSLEPSGLPVGRCKRTIVADIAAVILRPDAGRLLVGVERSRACFFRNWLLHAEAEVVRPAGSATGQVRVGR